MFYDVQSHVEELWSFLSDESHKNDASFPNNHVQEKQQIKRSRGKSDPLSLALGMEYGLSHLHEISPFHILRVLWNQVDLIILTPYLLIPLYNTPSNYPKSNPNTFFSSLLFSRKMAGLISRSVPCAILVVLCTVVPILAKDHTVGDSSGWAIGMDYSTWTSGKTFSVGDSLGESLSLSTRY